MFMLSAACLSVDAQSGEWTWMSGSSQLPNNSGNSGLVGIYGTKGTPAAANVPGSRYGANSWTDRSGNLWLFGGLGFDSASNNGDLNDLWEFNPSTSQWTWVSGNNITNRPGVYGSLGVAAPGNSPGSRNYAASWTDTSGNFWVFSGVGDDSAGNFGYLNDLWEFNPSTREWTWVAGSNLVGQLGSYGMLGTPAVANVPGGRNQSSTWTDLAGNLWLFGGFGLDSAGTLGYLNDFWEFNPSTKEWTWIGGADSLGCKNCGAPGVYGTLGMPASANFPGGRNQASSWTDRNGNLWLFGGVGFGDAKNDWGDQNDLWEFNLSTMEWAWIAGSSIGAQAGVYGTMGTPAAGNVPGVRQQAASWIDDSGNLWLFGGQGYDSAYTFGDLDDLWVFDPTSAVWTWMGGNSTLLAQGKSHAGQYGTLGTPSATNAPGGRDTANTWVDDAGAFWLFGGVGVDSVGNTGILNDLWKYNPAAPGNFTLSLAPGSLTIKSGMQSTITVTVTPQNGFHSAVTFACSGLAAGASCAFSPSSVTPSGGAATTTLTLTAQTLTASFRPAYSPLVATALLGVCCCFWRMARTLRLVTFVALAAAALSALPGCGGGGGSPTPTPTPAPTPVTSTVTVTSTSGALKQTATFSLTVD
jgi:N-acetylneuraminic acid mutarotase